MFSWTVFGANPAELLLYQDVDILPDPCVSRPLFVWSVRVCSTQELCFPSSEPVEMQSPAACFVMAVTLVFLVGVGCVPDLWEHQRSTWGLRVPKLVRTPACLHVYGEYIPQAFPQLNTWTLRRPCHQNQCDVRLLIHLFCLCFLVIDPNIRPFPRVTAWHVIAVVWRVSRHSCNRWYSSKVTFPCVLALTPVRVECWTNSIIRFESFSIRITVINIEITHSYSPGLVMT